MKSLNGVLHLNNENWGLQNFDLPQAVIGTKNEFQLSDLDEIKQKSKIFKAGAIKPKYDLDYVALHSGSMNHELDQIRELKKSKDLSTFEVFWPDEYGDYSAERCFSYTFEITANTWIKLKAPFFNTRFPLRIDPGERIGLVEIHNAHIVTKDGVVLLSSNDNNLSKFFEPMNELRVLNKRKQLSLFSTGCDPQLGMYIPAQKFDEIYIFLNVSIS
jgi:hypothetical protein